jgi:hypothetical protein
MADATITPPAPDAIDRDVAKRLESFHAIDSRLRNGMPMGLSSFPNIQVHINEALRATREEITCEQSKLLLALRDRDKNR